MFLQNLYTWKPFRAVAAAMLVLVMATACQETAQVINKPIIVSDEISSTKSLAQVQLTDQEKALGTELADDVDTQFLVETSRTMYVKFKMAATNKRVELDMAIATKDSKALLRVLNMTEEEFQTMHTQRLEALARWQKKFSSKQEMIQKVRNKYLPPCTTCKEMNAQNVSASLDRIAKTDMPPKVSELRAMASESGKNLATSQACIWWWQWTLLAIAEGGCIAAGVLCVAAVSTAVAESLGLLAPLAPYLTYLCYIAAAGCMADMYCSVCGCS
jgi:murein L,D-transpeptidase YcbB/YkuD